MPVFPIDLWTVIFSLGDFILRDIMNFRIVSSGFRNLIDIMDDIRIPRHHPRRLALLELFTNITKLDLRYERYNGSHPPQYMVTCEVLTKLKNIKFLYLSNSNIIANIYLPTSLVSLDVGYSKVRGDCFRECVNLRSLTLGYDDYIDNTNDFCDTHISDLTSLTSLVLCSSKIQGPGLRNLTGLTYLELCDYGDIRNHHISHLTNLTALKVLGRDANIHEILDVGTFKHLRKLDLVGVFTGCEGLLGLTTITDLRLRHTALTDEILSTLTNLTNLEINHTLTVGDVGLCSLSSSLTSLEIVNNSKITDESIKLLTRLKYLWLYDRTVIGDDGISCLKELEYLNLCSQRRITDRGISALQSNLTTLSIYDNDNISDGSVGLLTRLNSLSLRRTPNLGNGCLHSLSNLQKMTVNHTNMTSSMLDFVPSLVYLSWDAKYKIPIRELSRLTCLISLSISKMNDLDDLLSLTRIQDLTIINYENWDIMLERLRVSTNLTRLNGYEIYG